MENKYYTPEIEEFHEGFEFEVQALHDKQWIKTKFNLNLIGVKNDGQPLTHSIHVWLKNGIVRVKVLDREDIESFGYILDEISTKYGGEHRYKIKGQYPDEKWINVQKDNYKVLSVHSTDGGFNIDGPNHSCKFKGIIKNKSELKKIFQQIGI